MEMSDSYVALLDRDTSTAEVKEYFQDDLDLLNEFLDYGTYLIPRCFSDSASSIADLCLLFVLFRQYLCHLDGAINNLSQGNAFSAQLQIRSMLEHSFLLEWILKEDTDTKCDYLYVSNLRSRKRTNLICIPGTPELENFPLRSEIESSADLNIDAYVADNKGIDEILSKVPYSEINARFEPFFKKRGYDNTWHKIYLNKSIRGIANDIGKINLYTYFYSMMSGISHGSDIWKSVQMGCGKVEVMNLRELEDIPNALGIMKPTILETFRLMLSRYRPSEIENFNRKYETEWQTRFLKRYSINSTPNITSIRPKD